MTSAYLSVIFVCYLAGFILYFTEFESRSRSLLFWARCVSLLGLILHGAALVAPFLGCRIMADAFRPEFAIPFFVLSLSLAIEIKSRAGFLMLFSLPTSLVFLEAAIGRGQGSQKLLAEGSPWLWIHLGFVFSGMTVLVLSVSSAAMYLLQRSQLKSHRLGKPFLGLPSLDVLERIHTRTLTIGVPLFTLGLLSGLYWADQKNTLSFFWNDPTVILSIAACVLYWAILGMRVSSIGRGRRIAIGTLGVFILLLLAVLHTHTL